MHHRWVALSHDAARGAISTAAPTLAQMMARCLAEDVRPNLAPKTVDKYDMFTRLYVVPGLGGKRVDRLTVRDVQTWVNGLRDACQCCGLH